MKRRSVVLGLAAAPLFGALASLTGCDSSTVEDVPKSDEERNERVKASTDYMRQQYEGKAKKK